MPHEPDRLNEAYLSGDTILPGLEELIVGFCLAHPRLLRIVKRIVLLGNDNGLRTRLRTALSEKRRHGVWAPIRLNGGKPVKRQRRILVPFCEFEVTLKAWELLLADLENPKRRHKTINCRTPEDLTRALLRKIDNTLKAIAKKQVHYVEFDPHQAPPEINKPNNVVYIGLNGRTSTDPDHLDNDLDAKSFTERVKHRIDRLMPHWSGALRHFLADDGHEHAPDRSASYREREEMLRYIRDHVAEFEAEPLS